MAKLKTGTRRLIAGLKKTRKKILPEFVQKPNLTKAGQTALKQQRRGLAQTIKAVRAKPTVGAEKLRKIIKRRGR